MTNWIELTKTATNIIKSRQQLAKNNAQLKLDSVLLNNPDIKRVYQQRKGLVSKLARLQLEGKSTTKIKQQYKELGGQIKEMLQQKGIHQTDVLPQYSCKSCKDSGVINGKTCQCYSDVLIDLQFKNNGLNKATLPSFKTTTFDIVKDATQRKEAQALYKNIQKLVTAKNSKYNVATIFGDVGVGKTHLIECAARLAIESGLHTIYLSSFNFNQKMLEVHCQNVFEKENALKPYLECDLLFIDDMGSENTIRNVTVEYYFLILDERIRLNKLTMITTNLNFESLRQLYDDRIFSRIASNSALKFRLAGADLRLGI